VLLSILACAGVAERRLGNVLLPSGPKLRSLARNRAMRLFPAPSIVPSIHLYVCSANINHVMLSSDTTMCASSALDHCFLADECVPTAATGLTDKLS
jgi:hypothetical protein